MRVMRARREPMQQLWMKRRVAGEQLAMCFGEKAMIVEANANVFSQHKHLNVRKLVACLL